MFELLHNNLDFRKKKAQIVPMCSIFHLIQSCEKKLNNGSLEEVDALFGCSVVLFDGENLDDLPVEEVECACDMLFYTINWFKQLLNAFMFSTEEENYQARLFERLRNILLMESLLEQLMKKVPNYVPLEFHTIDTIKMTTATTLLAIGDNTSQSTLDETTRTKSSNGNIAAKPHTNIKLSSIQDLRSYTRAFDVHVLELLKYSEQMDDNDTKLTVKEIDYLLQDIEQKLDIKVSPPPVAFFGKKKADKHQQNTCNFIMLARVDARRLMKKVLVYLPEILQTLENLYAELQEKDIEPGHIDGSETLVECITRIFDIVFKLVSWPDIEIADNKDILKDIIRIVAERVSGKDPQQAFEYLSNYIVGIPKATTAVLLYKILLRFMALFNVIDNKYALNVVNQIVSTDWFDWRDIQKEIPFLFEESIEKSQASLSLLSDFVNIVLPRYEAEGVLEEYPLLKPDTINQHYQAIFNQTVKALDLLKDTDQDAEIVLTQTAHIVKIFERLTDYVKTKENRTLMGVLLKAGRIFIDQFTKHSVPYFSSVFKEHSPSILSIFKDLQSSTRMLQIICSHVKVLKDVSQSAYVPPLKKSLEIVIYQVKLVLIENRIPQSAFFMGALKHRDIHGAEVSSQDLSASSEEEQDEIVDEGVELQAIEEEDEQEEEDETDSQEKKHKKARKSAAPKRKRNSSAIRKQKSVQITYRTSSVVPSSSDEDNGEPEYKRKKATRKAQCQVEDEREEEEEGVIVFTDGDLQSDEDEPMDDKEVLPPSLSPSPSPSPPPPPIKKQSAPKRGSLGLSKSSKTFNLSK
ncbi:Fanconi anaemia protein FancD2 nuclease-domain-containing protein [Parasitella parasitica]|nr:Fanconi anaemia protein FancD2 nuclease-domain-containing protein [Parasitella parasitica]